MLDGTLYAADIDSVVMFNVEDGERLDSVRIEGAKFLNDATDWNGAIYVSDSGDAAIYRISDGTAELWLQDERLAGGSCRAAAISSRPGPARSTMSARMARSPPCLMNRSLRMT